MDVPRSPPRYGTRRPRLEADLAALAPRHGGSPQRSAWPRFVVPRSYGPTTTTPEICVGLSRRRRFAFRQASYAKWVRCFGILLERCFFRQNTVNDLFCVWVMVCMLCWRHSKWLSCFPSAPCAPLAPLEASELAGGVLAVEAGIERSRNRSEAGIAPIHC